jgi:hypothetical protein
MKKRGAADRGGKRFVQLFVNGGVHRVAGPKQHGVEMLVLIEDAFSEGDLAILVVRFAQLLDGDQPFRAQIGEHVLNAPKTVRPWFDAQADAPGGGDKLIFNILRHQPAFFDFKIALLKAGEVHVPARQCDARRLFVFAELVGIDA